MTIIAYMCGQVTAAFLFSSGHYVVVQAERMHLHAMNYLFWVVIGVVFWNAFLLAIALCLNRCTYQSGLSQYIELKEKESTKDLELQHFE